MRCANVLSSEPRRRSYPHTRATDRLVECLRGPQSVELRTTLPTPRPASAACEQAPPAALPAKPHLYPPTGVRTSVARQRALLPSCEGLPGTVS